MSPTNTISKIAQDDMAVIAFTFISSYQMRRSCALLAPHLPETGPPIPPLPNLGSWLPATTFCGIDWVRVMSPLDAGIKGTLDPA